MKRKASILIFICIVASVVSLGQVTTASNVEKPCWFIDKRHFKVNDINLIVRTINTHYNAPDYSIRLAGIAQQIKEDWPYAIGVIGMQEVKNKMTECLTSIRVYNGTECFASALSKTFGIETGYAYSVPNHVGVVAGEPWRIVGSDYWNVGSLFEKRYLLETRLIHSLKGWNLRFYTVHLSSQKRHRLDRLKQAREVIRIVRKRAETGELPPIVVGDFNAGRSFDGSTPEPAVLEMERYFWRPIDEAVGCHGDAQNKTGIDIVYIGKKTVFKKSKGEYVLVCTNNVNFGGIRTRVAGFPDFFDELTDHNSQGFSFHIRDGNMGQR